VVHTEMRMPRPTKLKSGIFAYRVRVPADVAEAFGKATIKKSLNTRDPVEAKRLFNLMHGENEAIWAQLRKGLVHLSQRQLVALSGDYYRRWMEQFHDNAGDTAAYQNLTEMTEGLAGNNERLAVWYGRTTDALLQSKGLRLSADQRTALIREMHKADVQARRQLQKNAEGDYRQDPDADRFPKWTTSELNAGTKLDQAKKQKTLSDLFAAWEATHRANGKSPRTVQDSRHKINSFRSFLGHELAEKITKQDVDRWCEHLRDELGIAPRTISTKYLSAIRATYRHAIDKGRIEHDPTKGYSFSFEKKARLRPKGFTDHEVRAILQATLDPARLPKGTHAHNRRVVRWLPWICAYTGARAGEVAQLRASDLRLEKGVLYLHITPEAGSVKSRNFRKVPLHPHLLEQGLPDIFEKRVGM